MHNTADAHHNMRITAQRMRAGTLSVLARAAPLAGALRQTRAQPLPRVRYPGADPDQLNGYINRVPPLPPKSTHAHPGFFFLAACEVFAPLRKKERTG